MQAWSGQPPAGAFSPARKFIATMLIVCSVIGLVAGFAVGGLTGQKTPSKTTNTGPLTKPTQTAQTTVTTTPTPTPPPDIVLGLPQFTPFPTPVESATGGTTYTVGMQAIDQHKKPVNSADVTCKLWLVKRLKHDQKLNIDTTTLKAVTSLSNSIQGTIAGTETPVPEVAGLTFSATTLQTAKCNTQGQITWQYTIAPSVTPGPYDLVILADWEGKHYNWSWTDITIQ